VNKNMSEKEIMVCDNCGKQSEDICGDSDWISINWVSKNGLVVSVSGGREENRNHKCKNYKEAKENVDFCSTECMLKWMGLNPKPEPNGFVILRIKEK
jgi:hypothetical protein